MEGGLTRRDVIGAGAALAAAAWLPAFRVEAAAGACVAPAGFPPDIELYRQGYENWAKAIAVDDLFTCAPRRATDVVRLANWAHRHGWRLRARGAQHNWSPICVTQSTASCDTKVVLVDTRQLNAITVRSTDPGEVRAGAGASILSVAEALEARGLGFASLPAIGDPTIGGGLAIGFHGAILPAVGERPADGHTYGSLANMVTSLQAVVWSRSQNRYVLRRFNRAHSATKALLVHLGRAFITQADFRVGPLQHLRCVSDVDIPATELFAAPRDARPGMRTFASLIDDAGRVETIQFPFTDAPWTKVWSVAPVKPTSSREVTGPYNYPFSDQIPEDFADAVRRVTLEDPSSTPSLGAGEYTTAKTGLEATNAKDLWGPAKDVLFYIRATTLRFEEGGLALLTSRRRLQSVVSRLYGFYARRLEELRADGRYPLNGPLEIRASGLDRAGDVGVAGAESAVLAPAVPRRDRPDLDVLLWCNPLSFHGTDGMYAFYREFEQFALRELAGDALLRTEWAKGWAPSNRAFWDDRYALTKLIPRAYSVGRHGNENWAWANRTLNRLDPHRVFSNDFLDRFRP